jgi:hypothetical protein
MPASINPLGERGRNQNYNVTVTAYIMSSTFAAGALGAVLGALGQPLARPAFAAVLVIAFAACGLLCDAQTFGWRVPGPRRQVNENWLTTYRGWVYGAGFGGQLGLGFTTIVTASATWVAFACALLSGSSTRGAVIGAAFGLVRALPVLSASRVRDPSGLRACVRRLDRGRSLVARVTAATQLASIGALTVALIAGAAS